MFCCLPTPLQSVVPYLAAYSGDAGAAAVCKEFHSACYQEAKSREMAPVEEEEGEDLCNCEFSLAYGGKILLNNARLHLKRGQRYGLCGVSLLLCSARSMGYRLASFSPVTTRRLHSASTLLALSVLCSPTVPASPPSCAPSPTASWTASPPSLSCALCTSSTTSTPRVGVRRCRPGSTALPSFPLGICRPFPRHSNSSNFLAHRRGGDPRGGVCGERRHGEGGAALSRAHHRGAGVGRL